MGPERVGAEKSDLIVAVVESVARPGRLEGGGRGE